MTYKDTKKKKKKKKKKTEMEYVHIPLKYVCLLV